MFSKIKSLFQRKKEDSFIGLIDETGVGKASFKGKFSLTFRLCAYIKNNGPLLEKEAVVRKKIPNFDYSIKGLAPLTIVELRGEQESFNGQNRINLSSVVKTKMTHPKLQRILEKRLVPVVFESEYFGNFLLDRRVDWFEAKVKWIDAEVKLFLSGNLSDIPSLASQAIQLFEKQTEWDLLFKHKITEDLLNLKNESWLEEEENPLSPQEFQEKIKLESLIIHKDNDFAAWFDDGDTFWGHAINIGGNLDGQLNKAGIYG